MVIALYILCPYTHIISTATPRTSWYEDEFVLPLEDLLFPSQTTDLGRLQNRKSTSCFWPIRVLLKCYSLRSSTHYHTSHLSLKGCPLGHTTTPNGVIAALYVLSHYYCDRKLNFGMQSFFNVIYVIVIRELCESFYLISLNYISENIIFYYTDFKKIHIFVRNSFGNT